MIGDNRGASSEMVTADIIEEAAFLCARLREFDGEIDSEAAAAEFSGHVIPPLARLEKLLAEARAPISPVTDGEPGPHDKYRASTCPCVAAERHIGDCPKHGAAPSSEHPLSGEVERVAAVIAPHLRVSVGPNPDCDDQNSAQDNALRIARAAIAAMSSPSRDGSEVIGPDYIVTYGKTVPYRFGSEGITDAMIEAGQAAAYYHRLSLTRVKFEAIYLAMIQASPGLSGDEIARKIYARCSEESVKLGEDEFPPFDEAGPEEQQFTRDIANIAIASIRPDQVGIRQALVAAYLRRRAEQRPSDGLIERQGVTEEAINYGAAVLLACADEIESGKYRTALGSK